MYELVVGQLPFSDASRFIDQKNTASVDAGKTKHIDVQVNAAARMFLNLD